MEVAVLSLPPPPAAAAVVVAAVGRAVAVADIVAADAVVGVAVVVVVAVGEFGSEETPVSVVAVESPQLG